MYRLNWRIFVPRLFNTTIGAFIGALGVIIFFAPSNIAPSGVSGIAVILNRLIETPIGAVILLGNIPILFLAYRMLGGLSAVLWTSYAVLIYSLAIDMLTPFFPTEGVSQNILLNAIFAGVIGGFAGGLILRGGGTLGGTSTLARIVQIRFGIPLSSTGLYVNILVVGLAGVFINWESALYSLVALMMEGIVTDYILEGPSIIRTATIITEHPQAVSQAIFDHIQRGITGWEATGMYTRQPRHILFVTVSRPQIVDLQRIVAQTDPDAFVVISQGHIAYGKGFKQISK
ncbi:MAG: YitT family protein [Phototrophicales bacterium]|nr:MAG: YitT family protein [Phototrophicales bacterium]RMG70837.1 MAG: YitT family protein [Chloroflexota bacterium]